MSGIRREVLIPGQTIEIPEELTGVFDVIGVVLDPDTPIRKTAVHYARDTYPTHYRTVNNGGGSGRIFDPLNGIIDPVDYDFTLRHADVRSGNPYRDTIPTASAIQVIESNPPEPKHSAWIGFAEKHLLGEPFTKGESTVAWELAVRLSDAQNGVRRFAANSLGEAALISEKAKYLQGNRIYHGYEPDEMLEITEAGAEMLVVR